MTEKPITAVDVLQALARMEPLPPIEDHGPLPVVDPISPEQPPPAEPPPERRVVAAEAANPDASVVRITLDNGELWAVPADDDRLAGVTVAPFVAPPAPLCPLSARQLRIALVRAGISAAMVEAAIGGMPAAQREKAFVEWEYATEFERAHPLIVQVGASLGIDAPSIDNLWRAAMAL